MPDRRRQVNLRLDPELYERVERLRGDTARQKWLERAVRSQVKTEERAHRTPGAGDGLLIMQRLRP